jgi:hypothetical protein
MSVADQTIKHYVFFKSVYKTEEEQKLGIESGTITEDFLVTLEERISNCKRRFEKVYFEQRVYLPPTIDAMIQRYIKEVLYESIQIEDYDLFATETRTFISKQQYLEKVMKIKDKCTSDILAEMHKFIGFK